MHIREHLRTVGRHRRLVRHYCLRLGLVWQGLTHDLSKYSPTEFWRSAKYYQGYRSPNDQERLENGVSLSWLHHKGRNRHHFEYWIDYCLRPDGSVYMGGCTKGKNIPMHRPMTITRAPRGTFSSTRRPATCWTGGCCC